MKINLNKEIFKYKSEFDKYYKKLLLSHLSNNHLSKVIKYGALNGGKRIRPFLIRIFSKISKVSKKESLRLGAVVESIHSYSLIHDDLPSMDNDDFRRGKPSVHNKFNEAQAILAGDALHDIAFEILSNKKTHPNPFIRSKLVNTLSSKLGNKGLAGGQSLDLIYEQSKTNKSNIIKMYKMKTSSLFSFCCMSPFIISKKNKNELVFANKFGETFGLVFQIIDDYLDEIGNFKKLGKTPGKDKKQGKSTILKHIDKKNLIDFTNKIIEDFIDENQNYFSKWKNLESLLYSILKRNN